jgi:4-amino-4-deoxy-L-arabinose transferase-like glycosyltransferase
MSLGSIPDSGFASAPFLRQHWWVIGLATLVAAALRMLELGEWSLWIDEAHTWRDATMPLTGENGFMESQRRFYPAPFLLLRFLFGAGVLGYDEWSVRLPFALMGIVSVPLLAICGRRFVGPWPAVWAACLLAINPWHIFWSQNARGYVMVVLGSVLAMHRMHVLFGSGRARDLLLAAAFVVLTAASHTPAISLAMGFAGFLAVRYVLRRRSLAGWLSLVVLALFLFGLPSIIRHYDLFSRFIEAKSDVAPLHWFETVAYYFRPSVLLLVLLAMFAAPRLIGANRALYLTCLVVVPMLALTSVGSQLVKVTARYAICTLPAMTLLVALLVTEVVQRMGRTEHLPRMRAWLLAGLLPGLLVSDYLQLDVAYFANQHGQRARWREAAQFVQQQAKLRGLAGVRTLSVNQPTLFYYLRPRHWFVGDVDPHPDVDVQAILSWRFVKGEDKDGQVLHEPGVAAHFAWHLRAADRQRQLFAVLITLPSLREKDQTGEFEATLRRDFELALYLPAWVGPKDESIYVYLPKKHP